MGGATLFSSSLLWAPLPLFFLQVLLILVVVRLLGKVLHAVNQPMVIGEIFAGILLGPSVAGYIPGFTETIFPDSSKDFLTLFSSVGLCFFMFFLGMEVDPIFMMQSWRSTLPIALISMSIPFSVGVGVATWLYTLEEPVSVADGLPQRANYLSFLLFIGTVFSFSAFPVLARILDSTKLISAPVGIQALGLAALEDVVAWCVLALIISYSTTDSGSPSGGGGASPSTDNDNPSGWNSILIFVVLVAFIALLMLVVRPVINYFYKRKQESNEDLNEAFIPYLFFGFLISSWFTETLGIHAFFGSFLFGCILPKEGDLIPILAPRIELLIVHIFLPIYFANSGMKTQLQKLDSIEVWCYCFIVIGLASVAKITSVTLSSKLVLGIRKNRIAGYLAEHDSSDSDSDDSETEELNHARFVRRLPAFDPKNKDSQSPAFGPINGEPILGTNAPQMQNQPQLAHSIANIDYDSENEHNYVDEEIIEDEGEQQQSSEPLRSRGGVGSSSRRSNKKRGGSGGGSGGSSSPSTSTRSTKPSPPSSNIGSFKDNRPNSTQSGALTPSSVHHSNSANSLNGDKNNPKSVTHSHSNRTHNIPNIDPSVAVDEEDQDEFGLDIHTGLPIVSDDENLIHEFSMNSWTHCLTLGVLLNSRGLVALIVLNIGLDKLIIGPKIFSLMLTMSLVCTCLTSPIVYALYAHRWQKALLKIQVLEHAEQIRMEEELEEEEYRAAMNQFVAAQQANGGGANGGQMVAGQLFEQEYHEQLAQMMEANRKASALPNISNAIMAEAGININENPMLPNTANLQSPLLSSSPPVAIPVPANSISTHDASAIAAAVAAGTSPLSGRSLRIGKGRSNTIGSGTSSGSNSASGSYIPPNLLARLGKLAPSVDTSAANSPEDRPTLPQLGLSTTRPEKATAGGVSRFAAPQLSIQPSRFNLSPSSALSPNSAGSNDGNRSALSSTPSPVPMLGSSLQRRPSSFMLGTSPMTSEKPGPGIDGARSISTRNLFAQQAAPPMLGRSPSRVGSGMNTPRGSIGGAASPRVSALGTASPRMPAPGTPRGGGGGYSVSNMSGVQSFGAPNLGGFGSSRALMHNRTRSVISPFPQPNLGRAASTLAGMSQTPVSPSFVPLASQFTSPPSNAQASNVIPSSHQQGAVPAESPPTPGTASTSLIHELQQEGELMKKM